MQQIRHELYWAILAFAMQALIAREDSYAGQFLEIHQGSSQLADIRTNSLQKQYNQPLF
jgi:hypothetical protein